MAAAVFKRTLLTLVFLHVIWECCCNSRIVRLQNQQDPLKKYETVFEAGDKIQYAKEGSNYRMKCNLKNGEEAIILWKVDGSFPNEPKFKILVDHNLLIRNVSQTDFEREYICSAVVTRLMMVESVRITLQPYQRAMKSLDSESQAAKPAVDEKNSEVVYAIVGELKTLPCSVHARPRPEFKWLFPNGTLIKNQSDLSIADKEDASNLTVFIRNANYYEDYICEAWNSLGRTEQRFSIRMPEKPTQVPFIFPKSIGEHKIVIGVQIKDPSYEIERRSKAINGEVLSLELQYKTLEATDWQTMGVDNLDETIGNNGLSLMDLESETTYLIRAAVKSRFVLGDFSTAIQVTTDKPFDKGTKALEKGDRDGRNRKFGGFYGKDGKSGQPFDTVEIGDTMNSTIQIFSAVEKSVEGNVVIRTTTIQEIQKEINT